MVRCVLNGSKVNIPGRSCRPANGRGHQQSAVRGLQREPIVSVPSPTAGPFPAEGRPYPAKMSDTRRDDTTDVPGWAEGSPSVRQRSARTIGPSPTAFDSRSRQILRSCLRLRSGDLLQTAIISAKCGTWLDRSPTLGRLPRHHRRAVFDLPADGLGWPGPSLVEFSMPAIRTRLSDSHCLCLSHQDRSVRRPFKFSSICGVTARFLGLSSHPCSPTADRAGVLKASGVAAMLPVLTTDIADRAGVAGESEAGGVPESSKSSSCIAACSA